MRCTTRTRRIRTWSKHIGVFHTDKVDAVRGRRASDFQRALRGESVERVDAFLTYPAKPEGAWVSLAARPLRDDRGAVRGAVAVSRDVTAERLAHEQLMISDRMASIGMMAAGVGHEINNPLSAVVANLEMAVAEVTRARLTQLGTEQLGDLPDEIREAHEAAQRVRRIALDLKVFSGGQPDENAPMNVEDVLDSAVRMGWNQVRNRAKVVKRLRQGAAGDRRGIAPRPGLPQSDRQCRAGHSRKDSRTSTRSG